MGVVDWGYGPVSLVAGLSGTEKNRQSLIHGTSKSGRANVSET